jgi:hypothetical protein
MIHGKKMVLVPFDNFNAHQDIPKAPAPVGDYSLMDEEMNKILKNKTVPEDLKWAKYDQVLQRYLAKLNRTKRDIAVTLQDSDDDSDNADVPSPQLPPSPLQRRSAPPGSKEADMDELLDQIRTSAQRKKAEKLYILLRKCSKIKWNAEGQTKIGKKPIGNIVDLIQHSMIARPRGKLAGWKEFTDFITSVNIPVSFVTNNELKMHLRRGDDKKINSKSPSTTLETRNDKNAWLNYSEA